MRYLVLTEEGDFYFRHDMDLATIDLARNGDYIIVDCVAHAELSLDTGGEWEVIPVLNEKMH